MLDRLSSALTVAVDSMTAAGDLPDPTRTPDQADDDTGDE
jgi:uncharacterized protein YidB (DUF937 family)